MDRRVLDRGVYREVLESIKGDRDGVRRDWIWDGSRGELDRREMERKGREDCRIIW